MGRYRCVFNCETSNDLNIKFFKFPLCSPRKLKKWLANMKWKDWTPDRFSVLCINHFKEQYIDRTGKCVTLRDDAVPTIFPDNTQNKNNSVSTRQKRQKPPIKPSEKTSAASPTCQDQSSKEPPGDKEQKHLEKWRIITDGRLVKIASFPRFFHGNYCIPQNIHWAADEEFSTNSKCAEDLIEVKESWHWLGLDVRGPLPQTRNGHKYILTVTDYFSRWVEAAPMQSCLPAEVAKNITDVLAHFGYPLRILSRLPQDIIHRINHELNNQLKISVMLVIYHEQMGSLDFYTPQMIDSMVQQLVEEHAADWDVYLPAKVFALCFKVHSVTKKSPFSLLCCTGLQPVKSPRGLEYVTSKIQESVFVLE